MRIRCRAISYDNLVFETDAVEIDQYKMIEHLRPTRLHEVVKCSSDAVITRSVIPKFLSYLRPLPLQPVIDSFMQAIEVYKGPVFTSVHTPDLDELACSEDDNVVSSYDDHRLNYTQDLELAADAIRRKSDDYLMNFLQHSDAITLPECYRVNHIRDCSPPTRVSCNLFGRGRHFTRSETQQETWQNKINKAEKSILSKDIAIFLWQLTKYGRGITDGRQMPDSMEEDATKYIFKSEFLEGTNEHYNLEDICRESMTIVLNCQGHRCLLLNEHSAEEHRSQLKNESDHFLRIDPPIPDPQTNYSGNTLNENNYTFKKFCLHRNRGLGMNCVVFYQRPLSTHKFAANAKITTTLADVERSMRSFLSEQIAILRTHKNDDVVSDQVDDLLFDPPLSPIPSDPEIPCPRYCRTRTPDLIIMKDTMLPFKTMFLIDKVKMLKVKSRRNLAYKEKIDKARLWQKIFLGPCTTNGLNLRSIIIIADRLSLKNSLFLPHLRETISCRIGIEYSLPTLPHIIRNIFPHRMRMCKIKDIRSVLGTESANAALQKDGMMRLLPSVSTDGCGEPTGNASLILSHDAFFSPSIEATCELTHLAQKVQNFSSHEDLEGPHVFENSLVDSAIMIPFMNKDATDALRSDRSDNNMNSQDVKYDSWSSTRISSLQNTDTKKRTNGPETGRHEISRKERKRLKMEKKLEKKARKLRKRKKQKSCKDGDLSNSNEVKIIEVPSLHIGVTPMVITRKIQTMTEEVSFSAHMPSNKRQRFCGNSNQTLTRAKEKHSSLLSMIAIDGSTEEYGRDSETQHHSVYSSLPREAISDNNVIIEEMSAPTHTYLVDGMLSESTGMLARNHVKESNCFEEMCRGQTFIDESSAVSGIAVDCNPSTDDESHIESIPKGGCDATKPPRRNQVQTLRSIGVLHGNKILSNRRQLEQNKDIDIVVSTNDASSINNQNHDISPPNTEDNHNSNIQVTEKNDRAERVIQILCGEDFFTHSSQAAAELSSGRWSMNFIQERRADASNIKFDLRDSRLVDDCGVDIELPSRVGVKVLWTESVFDSKKHCKNLVQLASTGRYGTIHVIIVLNVSHGSNYNANDLCLLQNALVKQRGCVCQKISFQYVAPSQLGATIAQLIISHPPAPAVILDSLFDDHVIEKVSFLLGLMPILTAYEALSVLNGNADWPLGRLVLRIARETEENSLINCCLSPMSLIQLRQCILANAGIFAST